MPDREPEFHELISEWLPWWDAAKAPYVPVVEIGRAPVREWIDGLEGEWSPAVASAMSASVETPEGHMVRWDHCSGEGLKYFMDRGVPFLGMNPMVPVTLDDIRFFELTEDLAARRGLDHELIMWRRPWVRARIVDGHPLEFRAFVLDGVVQGVSSYYPQRPLPDECDVEAQRAWDMTELLLGIGPLDFTCDWLVREDGTLVIIECGPPHVEDRPWADPCCFVSGQIHGIALRPMPGSDAERINASNRRGETQVPWIDVEPEADD